MRVFDGHNDVALRLWRAGDRSGASLLDRHEGGHIDLPRAREGGLAGGMFAIFVPDPASEGSALAEISDGSVMNLDPIPAIDAEAARRITFEQAGTLVRLAREHPDSFRLCRTVAEIEAAADAGAMAAIMHLEGCEGIGAELAELEALHAAGLRSLGPVWSRPNVFGHGVPFRFPGDPDEGRGLSEAGKRLVRHCIALGIMVDLSHLNAKGVDDVAAIGSAPLVATHSCVHAISPAARNLTDRQLDAIAASNGLVGLNYAVSFLRPDGRRTADTGLDIVIRHLDHLIERLGEGGVALGSDFDGALIPHAIGDAAGLPRLVDAMRAAGYGEALIERICWSNWMDVLRRTIG